MNQPTALVDVPAYLVRFRPDKHATSGQWAQFHEYSAEVYAAVVDTDKICGRAAAVLARLEAEQAEMFRGREERENRQQ